MCDQVKRLDARCPWPVRGLNAISSSSRNRIGYFCGRELDASVNHAQKWIEHCFGQIAVGSIWGLNTDVPVDGSRTRIVRGHGQAAVAVADRTSYGQLAGRCRRVPATSRIMRRKLCGRFVGCCAFRQLDANLDAVYLPSEADCFVDFSGNRPDASWLLRQLLCGHLPVMREKFPGNRPDTGRL